MVINMMENLKVVKEKELEYIIIKMEIDMKGDGKMEKNMEKENFFLIMKINMMEILKMIK